MATSPTHTTKTAFVTVGSTKFDALIHKALQQETILAFQETGFTHLVVQCGESTLIPPWELTTLYPHHISGIDVEIWKYKPSLGENILEADLVISHAGSGTILEALRARKKLIVVPNDTLLDNHQEELADALGAMGHVINATPKTLPSAISNYATASLRPFPAFDGSKFASLVDEELALS
ncbi:N-acetylglucosaminyldiphosphodolichol N-acetylglucosaminyltransferase catalytic subunit alg13 [Tulasnella sp. 330]|nr:N-acetylglucosaminyldiphosphodolichol N-acetylglucosaminyltransferase catalytic subunit alg13 [Tulasnella sp. 330]KAG8878129.1 N-acetylglucosaminyldiphosphodolichol N-acetylglucosaminyltransferase catalytic subunit alg13 [Tulasnella sp. 331]KAG8883481.1 N-acetylglucosaminyldiphosphodolichol N-acetylglucosaminyltransferase catalytic subunit alg13 [Tulasnella sp. 332]